MAALRPNSSTFSTKVDPQIVDMDLNRSATHLVTASRSNLRILSIEENSFRDKQTIRVGKKSGLNFSLTGVTWKGSDENIIASGSSSGAVIVWNLALSTYSKQERMFTYHNRTCNSVAFHSSEPLLMSGSQDGTCIMYDTRKPNMPPSFFHCEEAVRHVQFYPSHYFLFIACVENGSIKVFDIRRPDHCERSFTCHNGPVFCSAFHPTQPDRLATAGRDRTIKVWDLHSPSTQSQAGVSDYALNSPRAVGSSSAAVGVPLMAYSITSIAPVSSIGWRPQRPNHIACTSLSETRICVFDVRRPCIPYATFEHYADEQPIRAMWLGDDPDSIISCGRDGTIFHHCMRDASRPADSASPQGLAVDHAHEQVLFSCSRQLLFDAASVRKHATIDGGRVVLHNPASRNSLVAAMDLANFNNAGSSNNTALTAAAPFLILAAALPALPYHGDAPTASTITTSMMMPSNNFAGSAVEASTFYSNIENDSSQSQHERAGGFQHQPVSSFQLDYQQYEASFKSELLVLSERAMLSRFFVDSNPMKSVWDAVNFHAANLNKQQKPELLPLGSQVLPHSQVIKLTAQFISLPTYGQSSSASMSSTGDNVKSSTIVFHNYANVEEMCERNALLALALNKEVEAQTWRMLAVMLLMQTNHDSHHRNFKSPSIAKNANQRASSTKSSFMNGEHVSLDRNHSRNSKQRRSMDKTTSGSLKNSTHQHHHHQHSRQSTATTGTTTTTTTTTDSERDTDADDADDDEQQSSSDATARRKSSNYFGGLHGNDTLTNSHRDQRKSILLPPLDTPPLNDMPMGAGELLFGEQTVPEDFDLAFLSSTTANGANTTEANFNMLYSGNHENMLKTGNSFSLSALPSDPFAMQHDLKLGTARTTSATPKQISAAAGGGPTTTPPAGLQYSDGDSALLISSNNYRSTTSTATPRKTNNDFMIRNGLTTDDDDRDDDDVEGDTNGDRMLKLHTNFELASNHHTTTTFSNSVFNYDAVIAELIRFCIDQSDLQLACHVIIMLGNEHALALPGVTEHQLTCWFTEYVGLLRKLRCFAEANRITRLCPIESVRTLNCVSTSIHVCCGQCGATMPNNISGSSGGGGPSPHRCAKCRHMSGLCALCHLPVRGAMIWCQGCSHGGHWAHMLQWFRGEGDEAEQIAARRDCPAGCGHMCEYAFRL